MLTGVQLYIGFKKDLYDIDSQLESIASTQVNALSSSLWSIDTDQVQIQIKGMVNFSNIAFVELDSSDYSFEYGTPLEDKFITKTYKLDILFNNEKITLGTLYVQADLRDAYNEVWDRFLVVLISNAIKTFLVSFFMFWLFNLLITRPIGKLTETALKENKELKLKTKKSTHNKGDIKHAFDQVNEVIYQLKKSNQEMEHFCYTLSHDLKSPMVTILGFAELAKLNLKDGNESEVYDDISRIESAGDKMLQLLHEILQLIRYGQVPPVIEPVNLKEVVSQAILLVSGNINKNKVQLVIADTLPIVRGDKSRLLKVFQNLIDNAAKFSGDSPNPIIEVGTTTRNNKQLVFVKDNGKGIDPKFHQLIFGLFNVLEPSKNSTGVGLAIVKRIVDNHNWNIWVESEGHNKGTTFYIDINHKVSSEKNYS